MTLAVSIQLVAACLGVIGSLFFAIGVMRQSVVAMADISGTYWNFNPHMITNAAAQKADYLFGGGIIVLAFAGQVVSLLVPTTTNIIGAPCARLVPLTAVGGTIALFIVLRLASRRLSARYASQIRAEIVRRDKEQADSTTASGQGQSGA